MTSGVVQPPHLATGRLGAAKSIPTLLRGDRRPYARVLSPAAVAHFRQSPRRSSIHALLLRWTSLDIEYLREGKNISGDERGGFRLVTVNLPLPDARLRLFIQGREDWLEEGLLVPARKNKRGIIVEEGSNSAQAGSAQPNVVPPFGGIPPPPSFYRGPKEQARGVVHRYPHQIMWCPT
jgi:hypothetical protein